QVNGMARSGAAALDAMTGALLPWNPQTNSGVQGFSVSGNSIVLTGDFTSLGSMPWKGLAQVDLLWGVPSSPWNPGPQYYISPGNVSIVTDCATGFSAVGGHIYAVNAVSQAGYALFQQPWGCTPAVSTLAPTSVSDVSATLQGMSVPNGAAT